MNFIPITECSQCGTANPVGNSECRRCRANLIEQETPGEEQPVRGASSKESGISFVQLYSSLDGRVDRSTFWLEWVLPAIMFQGVIGILDVAINAGGFLLLFVAPFLLWPAFIISVKRLHDRGKSAWWLLVLLIPIIGLIWYDVELGFLPGTDGGNEYGPQPWCVGQSMGDSPNVRTCLTSGSYTTQSNEKLVSPSPRLMTRHNGSPAGRQRVAR